MVARGADGVVRTEPLKSPIEPNGGGHAPPPVSGAQDDAGIEYSDAPGYTQETSASWHRWFRSCLEHELFRGEMGGGIIRAAEQLIDERIDERVGALELKLAEAGGALDVLCGKGAPGSLNVLRQEMLDSVGDALGVARADFEGKLAVQAKRISELELKLAEAVGAINILRGKGAPGSFNVKGTFDAGAVYNELDVVMHGGSSWVATRDRPGDLPGDGWQLLASAGKRGPRGERGPIGHTGADASRWTSISFDAKRMSFTTRMSDGSLGPLISLDFIFAGVDVDPATYSVNFKMLDGSEFKFSLRGLFEHFFQELKGR